MVGLEKKPIRSKEVKLVYQRQFKAARRQCKEGMHDTEKFGKVRQKGDLGKTE